MKAKEEVRLSSIRMLKSALMKWKADNMKEPDPAAEMQVMNSLMKQRREAADVFRKAGREDSALKEEAEFAVIESYMPAGASAEEIQTAIEAALAETGVTDPKQMGVVMKAVQAKLTGKRVDGKALSDQVRARLTA